MMGKWSVWTGMRWSSTLHLLIGSIRWEVQKMLSGPVGSREIGFESQNTGVGQFLDRRFDRMARRGLAASKLAVVNR